MKKHKRNFLKSILILSLIFMIVFSCINTGAVKVSAASKVKVSTDSTEWGITRTGIDRYVKKLTEDGNDVEIKIAVLDTGINVNHEIFQGRLDLDTKYARDFANYDTTLEDLSGTGTAIASIIAQCTPSNVKIIPVKVVDYESQIFYKLDELYSGLQAVANYADIICFGMGIDPIIPTEEQITGLTNTLSNELYNENTVLLSNVGDLSTATTKKSVHFPAFLNNFVTATSVDSNLQIADTACVGDRVDFALPGIDIKVASNTSNTGYKTVSGSRYALGFLGGAFANVKAELRAVNPASTNDDVIEILKENCIDLGDEGRDDIYGYGFIDFRTNRLSNPIEVSVVNSTSEKAVVSFVGDGSSNGNFTTEVETGELSVTCEIPCFVLTTSDSGESYSIIEGMVSDSDANTYNYEIDLVEGIELVVAIKGDTDFNGIVNRK